MQKSIIFFFYLSLFISVTDFSQTSLVNVVSLKTQYKINPVVETLQPRLSWELQSNLRDQYQSAYQIIVASSLANAKAGNADVWDSGKILSDKNILHYFAAF